MSEESDNKLKEVVDVLVEVKPCPHCGGSKLHRHSSSKEHIVLTHNHGCLHGKISVFKDNNDPKLSQWNQRA